MRTIPEHILKLIDSPIYEDIALGCVLLNELGNVEEFFIRSLSYDNHKRMARSGPIHSLIIITDANHYWRTSAGLYIATDKVKCGWDKHHNEKYNMIRI